MGLCLPMVGVDYFSPAFLSGLAVWLDARDLATLSLSGALVTSWKNKGNQGLGNASHGTAANQPKLVTSAINGYAAIEGLHDGVNPSNLFITDAASLNHATGFTAFTVINRVTDLGAVAEFVAGKYIVTGNQREFRQILISNDFLSTTASPDGTSVGLVTASLSSDEVTVASPAVFESHWDATNVVTRKNGTTSASSAMPAVFDGTGNYMLFSRALAEPYAGYIGENLFFNRALTSTERLMVVAYLKNKWGIA